MITDSASFGAALDRYLTHDPREDQPECEDCEGCEEECTGDCKCYADMDDGPDPDDERDRMMDREYADCYD